MTVGKMILSLNNGSKNTWIPHLHTVRLPFIMEEIMFGQILSSSIMI